MLLQELKSFQTIIQNLIQIKAKSRDNAEIIEPIYDGVCDLEGYLKSEIKVMWMLKEAYDDFDESGMPKGGGWEIYESWPQEEYVKSTTAIRSWQPIMYVLRALAEDNNWDDVPWIRDDREKYVEFLRSCAYINVNKMPAGKTSGDLSEKFEIWSDVINAQILGYAPDVIIFGNTFPYFKNQCYVKESKRCNGVQGATGVYVTKIGEKPTLLIDAYHPNQKTLTREVYVDSILESIRSNMDKIRCAK